MTLSSSPVDNTPYFKTLGYQVNEGEEKSTLDKIGSTITEIMITGLKFFPKVGPLLSGLFKAAQSLSATKESSIDLFNQMIG